MATAVPPRSPFATALRNCIEALPPARMLSQSLFSSENLRREYVRTLCPSVAAGPEHHRLTESGGAEFLQEGTAFLGAGDSCEPVCFAAANLQGKRCAQYEFRGVSHTSTAKHAGEFPEDRRSRRIQIEDAIDQGNVCGSGFDR
jgi:hypothetical protein